MNDLVEHPQFYNALTDNCTTVIRQHVQHVADGSPLDWRILANGYLDQLLFERDVINTREPLAVLKAHSLIDVPAKAADQGPAFSQRIRDGLPPASGDWKP